MDAGWSPQCEDYPVGEGGWGVLKTTAVQWCEFQPYDLASIQVMKHFSNPGKVRWLEAAYDYARGISSASKKP